MSKTSTLAVTSLCAVQFIDVLGVTVVTAALPRMLADLGVPSTWAAVVVTSYAAAFASLLLPAARAGDLLGHRRVLLAALGLFALASLVAATATVLPVLALARCLQGAAAAAGVPPALALLARVTPQPQHRARAMAAWSATGAVAGASGLLIGGVLTSVAGWRSAYWLNLPLAAVLVVAVAATVPSSARPASPTARGGRRPRGAWDAPGAGLVLLAVAAAVVGADALGATGTRPPVAALWLPALCAAVSVAAAVALVRIERRAAHPLLPPQVTGDATVRAAAGVGFVNTATTSSAVTVATLWLQDHRGLGPAAAAAHLVPFSLAVVGGSFASAPLVRHSGARRTAVVGLALIAVGDAALLASTRSLGWLVAALVVAGAGLGAASVAANHLAISTPAPLRAAAAGAVSTSAQLGTALGVAAALAVAASAANLPRPVAGTSAAWLLTAVGAAVAAVALQRAQVPPS